MIAFMALLYGVYMAALVVVGVGLYLGVFPGPAPFAITIVPAIFGAVVIAMFLGVSLLPGDFDRLVMVAPATAGRAGSAGSRSRLAHGAGGRGQRRADRDRPRPRARTRTCSARSAWWGFDIAVLWACFHAFGDAPPKGGDRDGLLRRDARQRASAPGRDRRRRRRHDRRVHGVRRDAELSVVAVLAYRAFAFWLPTLPGAVAYLQLRRTVQRWDAAPGLGRRRARPNAERYLRATPSYT